MAITYDKEKLKSKAITYCDRNNARISHELGFGTQGIVFQTAHKTALKVYELERGYQRERGVYQRLKEREITSIMSMQIPQIVSMG